MDFKHFFSTKTKLPYKEFEDSLITEKNEEIHLINGIPRFVDDENYAAAFGLQWNIFSQTQFDSFTKQPISEKRLETALGQPLETIRGLKILEAGSRGQADSLKYYLSTVQRFIRLISATP